MISPSAHRVARVQKTLNWFENDIPFLDLRVRELSAERQRSARQFAAALIDETRAELQRLLSQDPQPEESEELPCEPAD
jgi:hypothetical protein